MKIIRSTKCSLKFTTARKQRQLDSVLKEYARVTNFFINYFWSNPTTKAQLLKSIVNLPTTWLTARLCKVAAREALDMISASKKRWGAKAVLPLHRGQRMCVSSTIAELQQSNTTNFDAWLHLNSLGRKIVLDLPIKFHRHFSILSAKSKRLNAYIITRNSVQFVFERETGPKKNTGNDIGIDTGINKLASTSTQHQYGEIRPVIESINRKVKGSKAQKKERRHLRHLIDETVKTIFQQEDPRLIVVENLKGINQSTKARLPKATRKLVSNWNQRYWLSRLQQKCEENRVYFRTVAAYNTSITCSKCGNVDRKQRVAEVFICSNCNHQGNADLNAATNILNRCLSGVYCPTFK